MRRNRPLSSTPRRSVLAALAAAALVLVGTPASALADQAGAPAGDGNQLGFLDLGTASSCAVQRDRAVRCWGRGSSGALGTSDSASRLGTPGSAASTVPVGLATQVATGDLHACAIVVGGSVRCWGQGAGGQLGGRDRDNRLDGYVDPRTGTDEATTVPLGAPALQLSLGGSYACAVIAGGVVRCWGDGLFGRVGARGTDHRLDGLPDGPSDEASVVPLGGAALSVSAGDQHACALLVDGSVRCWGAGANGRLGSGATDDRLDGLVDATSRTDEPSTVPLGGPATAVSAGGGHTCALMATGDVRCWGLGTSGQLGTGTNNASLLDAAGEQASTVPIKPIGTTAANAAKTPNLKAVAISAGDSHTCAIVEGGDVRCWGAGDQGQLGQGATDGRLDSSQTAVADAATRVGGGPDGKGPGLGSPAVAITAGSSTTCAALDSGAVRCWGNGDSGRVGSGATDARLDGVVDPATGTDDASLVPIAAPPANAADGLPAPAPQSDPAALPVPTPAGTAGPGPSAPQPTPAPLAATATLKGRRLSVRLLLQPSKAGRCPKKVGVSVKVRGKKVGRSTLKVSRKGAFCRAAGRLRTKRSVKRRTTAVVHVSGAGVTARDLTVVAR
ncbi:MAG: hypothetical protein PGN13_08070 [Patulibacter minatonensis]